MPDEQRRFWAFVSYSSKDVAVAKRLHRRLENYRVPRSLVGRPGRDGPVPRRLFPAFRDRDELPLSADLGASIQDALRASRYLIVVCSRAAARSVWVNEEIRFFKSLGRADRIFAVIVDGEPNAADKGDAANECFPPALRHQVDADGRLSDRRAEPIAGDLRPGGDGWTATFLKAVAGVTGLGFDAFVKRDRQRRRRRLLVAAALLLTAVLSGVWYWDGYHRPIERYYTAYVDRWGQYEGVGPTLSPETVRRRHASCKLTSRGRRRPADVLEFVNGSGGYAALRVGSSSPLGSTRDNAGESVRRVIERNEAGRVVAQRDYNATGEELFVTRYAEGQSLAYYEVQGYVRPRTGTGAAYVALTREKTGPHQGIAVEHRYTDADRRPQASDDGEWVFRRTLNAAGLVAEDAAFDDRGQPVTTTAGHSISRYRYDDKYNLVERTFFDRADKPTLNKKGYFRETTSYDEHGNPVEVRYFDADGKPVVTAETAAWCKYRFDGPGNLVESQYLDGQGQPIVTAYGSARIVSTFDGRGDIVGLSCFDAKGRPAYRDVGYCTIKYQRDAAGRITAFAYFDENGSPAYSNEGFARMTREYDARGNNTAEAYFDAHGKPIRCDKRHAGLRQAFDDRGKVVRVDYFGPDGEPTLSNEWYARKAVRYDNRGNRVEESYFDEAGRPTLCKKGYARIQFTVDENGLPAETAYFDPNGNPTQPTKTGYARFTYGFDRYRTTARTRFFDEHGQSITNLAGAEVLIASVDDRFNMIEAKALDVAGNLAPRSAIMRTKHDARGNEIEESAHTLDGRLTRNLVGYVGVAKAYDHRNKVIEERYFDEDRKPVVVKLASGWYARAAITFDDRGNQVHTAFFDEADRPMTYKGGVASVRQGYDERNRLIETAYFDDAGKPVVSADGHARETRSYDDRGRLKDQRFFKPDGAPGRSKDKVCRLTGARDEFGNEVDVRFFDAADRPVESSDGVAGWAREFDRFGNCVRQRGLDVQGNPKRLADGDTDLRYKFDARGNVIEVANHDADGKLRNWANGSAVVRKRFDARGNELEAEAVDQDGKPFLQDGRYVKYVKEYDRRGYQTRLSCLDAQGRLTRNKEGYAQEVMANDDMGRQTVSEYLDEAGKPVMSANGFARAEARYDEFGNTVDAKLFDASGQPITSVALPYHTSYVYERAGRQVTTTQLYRPPANAPQTPEGPPPVKVVTRRNAADEVIDEWKYQIGKGSAAEGNLLIVGRRKNAAGRMLEFAFFDGEYRPTLGPGGFWRKVFEHDARGYESASRVFDLANQLKADATGVAGMLFERDQKGRAVSEQYLGADGKPTRRRDGGFAKVTSAYDDATGSVESRFFDEAGAPIASATLGVFGQRVVKDDKGRSVEERYLDARGEPMRSTSGVAGAKRRFDPAATATAGPVEVTTIDESGNPCRSTFGYVTARYARDARGNAVVEEYMDERGAPAAIVPGGHWRVESTFNDANRPVARTVVYGTAANPAGVDGVYKFAQTLNDRGLVAETRFLNAAGEPMSHADGHAGVAFEYDAAGRSVAETRLDPQGRPTDGKDGWCRYTQTYDGNVVVETAYFNAAGEPAVGSRGFAKLLRKPGAAGRPSTWTALDPAGQPLATEVALLKVFAGGQAEQAGLQPDDVLATYNGAPIFLTDQLMELIDLDGNPQRQLVVLRAGRRIEVTLSRGKMGIQFQTRPRAIAPPAETKG